ncbi:MAG: SseB family protein [Clostridiales bacterium]|nr:SseB family protein [Clostridiales bacterium]
MSDHTIAKEITELKEAYALFSPLTNMPYTECEPENYWDQVLMYASREDADAAVKEYEEKGIRTAVREFKTLEVYVPVNPAKPEGEKKKMYLNQVRQHLGVLPFMGVNAVGYKPAGAAMVTIELTEILPKGFEKKVEENGFYQPTLQLTGVYLMQEARRKKEFVDMKHIQELDEEFSSNLVKSRLFIAVLPPEGHEKDPQLNLKECRMPYLKHQNGEKYFPVFSDVWEFQKYAQNNKTLRPIQVPFRDLPKFWVKDAQAYMMNPMGISVPLKQEMIPKLMERFGGME